MKIKIPKKDLLFKNRNQTNKRAKAEKKNLEKIIFLFLFTSSKNLSKRYSFSCQK